ncbi:MAG: PilZ domain-containing protein [Candidatus Methylomirabilales bacterium]
MRQRSLRHSIQVPVLYKKLDRDERGSTGMGWTEDLGEQCACLKLPATLHLGGTLGLIIFAEPEVIEAEARVVWVRSGGQRHFYYHGVEFIRLSPTYYESLLRALHQERSSQQREMYRFPITRPISCQVGRSDSPPLEGQTADISRAGAMVFLPERVPAHTRVEIMLHAPHPDRIRGRVRWVADSDDHPSLIRHGIEFVRGPLAPQRFLNLFSVTLPEEHSGDRLSTLSSPL